MTDCRDRTKLSLTAIRSGHMRRLGNSLHLLFQNLFIISFRNILLIYFLLSPTTFSDFVHTGRAAKQTNKRLFCLFACTWQRKKTHFCRFRWFQMNRADICKTGLSAYQANENNCLYKNSSGTLVTLQRPVCMRRFSLTTEVKQSLKCVDSKYLTGGSSVLDCLSSKCKQSQSL